MKLTKLLLLGLALSSMAHAKEWKKLTMRSNLPPSTIAIAASNDTLDFLAITPGDTYNSYTVFSLDHNQLQNGWNKTSTIALPGMVFDLIFGQHLFFATGMSESGPFVAISSDTINWDVTTPKTTLPFIGVGSDGSEHSISIFPTSSGENASYVAIGSDDHFVPGAAQAHVSSHLPNPAIAKKFMTVANTYQDFIGIGSDGSSYRIK